MLLDLTPGALLDIQYPVSSIQHRPRIPTLLFFPRMKRGTGLCNVGVNSKTWAPELQSPFFRPPPSKRLGGREAGKLRTRHEDLKPFSAFRIPNLLSSVLCCLFSALCSPRHSPQGDGGSSAPCLLSSVLCHLFSVFYCLPSVISRLHMLPADT
jgi:hypothetical protein